MAPSAAATRTALAAVLVAGVALGGAAGVAAGKTVTIKGKLKGSSLASAQVIAVGKTTGVVATKARKGSFSLKLPSSFRKSGATLHIVRANGTYAAPIVLRKKKGAKKSENQAGGTGYQGLSGSVGNLDLGTVAVSGGAANPSAPAPTGATSGSGVPLKANGAPQGAGELGLVVKPGATGDVTQGGDADKDGIVNAVDVDMNGNGVLNSQDTATQSGLSTEIHPFLFSSLFVPYAQATTANADAFTANVQQYLTVNFGASGPGAASLPSLSVDCQGIAWCGTATVKTSDYGYPAGTPWPRDAAGLYTVGHRLSQPDYDIGLLPNQPPSAIAVGSTFRFVAGSATSALAMAPYFQAPPVLMQLGSATLGDNRPASISVNRASVTVTLMRPLRAPVPGAETGTAISMGTLNYGVMVQRFGNTTPGPPAYCPASAFSALSPTLAPATSTMAVSSYGISDSATDSAPGPDRTISFTVDLTKCGGGPGGAPAAAPATNVTIDVFAQDAANNQAITQGIPLALQ